MINVPISLTIFRILLIPFIVQSITQSKGLLGCLLLVIAAVTDVLDGAWARYFNQKTDLGGLLDPLADKILLISCYTALILHPQNSYITAWFFGLSLIREFCILLGTSIICYKKNLLGIAQPTVWGKLAMFGQILFLMIACLHLSHPADLAYLNFVTPLVMMIASICMAISWIQYVRQGLRIWYSS